MGYHNLPPSYDAWRLTPPNDSPSRLARFEPDTVSAPLCIEAGEVQIDATGTYDADTGSLLSVRINGVERPVHTVSTALGLLCGADAHGWDADLDPYRLTELVDEAAQDAEADWGDYRHDMRGDH